MDAVKNEPCVESKYAASLPHGYPRLRVNGRVTRHHRAVWESHNGPIPDRMEVRHLCGNKKCININHLAVGTRSDNERDKPTYKGENLPPHVYKIPSGYRVGAKKKYRGVFYTLEAAIKAAQALEHDFK